MTPLEDRLKFERISLPPLPGTPLAAAALTSHLGLDVLAVPVACVGLAFRVSGTNLEALSVSCDDAASIVCSISLGSTHPAVNIAASADGRLVAVCLADGSLHYYNYCALSERLRKRWLVEGADSLGESVTIAMSRNMCAALHGAGPACSLEFSPKGSDLAMIVHGRVGIYHAEYSELPVVTRVETQTLVACGAWSPVVGDSDEEYKIALGTYAGYVLVYKYNTQTCKTTFITRLAYPWADGAAEHDPRWSCTHVEWIQNGTAIAAGYCRVVVPLNPNKKEEHQTAFYISNFPPNDEKPQALGIVAPFFSVPRHGRHVYFSAVLPTADGMPQILLVTNNASSDVSIVCRHGSKDKWQVVDLQDESNTATTPTDGNDEFMYPTGLAFVMTRTADTTRREPILLLPATDGSLTCFRLTYQGDESYFLLGDDVRESTSNKSPPDTRVPATPSRELEQKPQPAAKAQATESLPSVAATTTVSVSVFPPETGRTPATVAGSKANSKETPGKEPSEEKNAGNIVPKSHAASSNPYPPMAMQGQKLVGGADATSSKSSGSSTGAHPSASGRTPKLVSGAASSKCSLPSSSSYARYPPMSAQAPKPFAKTSPKGAPSLSSPYFRMAPKMMGGAATSSKSSGSSMAADSPMSGRAPKPLGDAAAFSNRSLPSSSAYARYPPMSAQAPKPFGPSPASSSKGIAAQAPKLAGGTGTSSKSSRRSSSSVFASTPGATKFAFAKASELGSSGAHQPVPGGNAGFRFGSLGSGSAVDSRKKSPTTEKTASASTVASMGFTGSTLAAGPTSSSGTTGFSFGGGGSASIGSSGIAFGGVSGGENPFGSSTGFQFGSLVPPSGFSFGQTTRKVSSQQHLEGKGASGIASTSSATESSDAHPPMVVQAPKPVSTIGAATKPAASAVTQSPKASSLTVVPTPAVDGLAGKSLRDMLTAFYQVHNPAKVAEVDQLLAKYSGREEDLFRGIAKKYNVDPATLGLPPVVETGFGRDSISASSDLSYGCAPRTSSPVKKIAMLGDDTVSKAAVLNALLHGNYSDASGSPTTSGVRHFRLSAKRETGGHKGKDSGDSPSKDQDSVAVVDRAPKTPTATLPVQETTTTNSTKCQADTVIYERVVDVELEDMFCEMRKGASLILVDIPSFTGAGADSKDKDYVEQMWETFDGVVIVLDPVTEDQVALLEFSKHLIDEKKEIPLIILCNGNFDDSEAHVQESRKEVERVFGVSNRDDALITLLESSAAATGKLYPVFIPISATSAFIYRTASLMNMEQFQKLDKDMVAKVGHDEVGKYAWKKLSDEERYKVFQAAVADESHYKERLEATNFDKLLSVLAHAISGEQNRLRLQVVALVKSLAPQKGLCKQFATMCTKADSSGLSVDSLKAAFWGVFDKLEDAAFQKFAQPRDVQHLADPMVELQAFHKLARQAGWQEEEKKSIFRMKSLVRRQLCVIFNNESIFRSDLWWQSDEITWNSLSPEDWKTICRSILLVSCYKSFCSEFGQEKVWIESVVDKVARTSHCFRCGLPLDPCATTPGGFSLGTSWTPTASEQNDGRSTRFSAKKKRSRAFSFGGPPAASRSPAFGPSPPTSSSPVVVDRHSLPSCSCNDDAKQAGGQFAMKDGTLVPTAKLGRVFQLRVPDSFSNPEHYGNLAWMYCEFAESLTAPTTHLSG